MPNTVTNASLPAALVALVDKYANVQPRPVRFRPATWQQALVAARPRLRVATLLRDAAFTEPIAGSKAGDRTVARDAALSACATMDLGDEKEVLQAFVLTMAWSSEGVGNQSLRATARAVRNPERAHRVLADSARRLRSAESLRDGTLEANHRAWSLWAVGQSFASRWWSLAGYVPGRSWQPLVLDERVYASLNRTLMIGGTTRLASSRRRADRYRAYVETLHRWAVELGIEGRRVDAARIAFVLGLHNGAVVPTR
ncbi:hypothetical protein [Jiangella asiatica]|uniref:Uncharacterized protein n=1 Tax=Jiangella asiatica TaxID=2530372 RepID=A0A4R5D959_9ACTN|nr:hypothetical protein [Jiangella asiatica]TDE10122.1 hypothetical protein E1269_12440 [Jiangella asiatica]